jgi:hypothetical protein
MKRLFIILLLSGLTLAGYNCNPSSQKMSDELVIEEQELEYDVMEKEIIKEANQYEKQSDLLQKWEESENDILEEDLAD